MAYLDFMKGAGLGDVLIPKEEFIKEHERLVALLNHGNKKSLRKEAKEQQAELETRGGSGKSNFIARLMAETKYKHRSPSDKNKPYDKSLGEYKKPVMNPENDETDMNKPIKFDYNMIANENQVKSGANEKPYGASPFITKHFGHASVPMPKESALQKEARRQFTATRKALREKPADGDKKELKDQFVSKASKTRKASKESFVPSKRYEKYMNARLKVLEMDGLNKEAIAKEKALLVAKEKAFLEAKEKAFLERKKPADGDKKELKKQFVSKASKSSAPSKTAALNEAFHKKMDEKYTKERLIALEMKRLNEEAAAEQKAFLERKKR